MGATILTWSLVLMGIALLGFGLAMARSWAVWYLRKEREAIDRAHGEAIAEYNAMLAAAAHEIELTRDAAIYESNALVLEYINLTDGARWQRPAKAAKLIRDARRSGDARGYLTAMRRDPEHAQRYCAWRATQTKRRSITTNTLEDDEWEMVS